MSEIVNKRTEVVRINSIEPRKRDRDRERFYQVTENESQCNKEINANIRHTF